MPTAADYLAIGTLGKAHGLKGAIKLHLDAQLAEEAGFPEIIFIKEGQTFVPLFVLEVSSQKANYILVIEDSESPEDADRLSGKAIFVTGDAYKEHFTEANPYAFLTGFTAVDQQHGTIGQIADVMEMPGQYMLQIFRDEQEILIPLIEEQIEAVDYTTKHLHLHTPEGLLELYL